MGTKDLLRKSLICLLIFWGIAFRAASAPAAEFRANWQVSEGNKIGEIGKIYVKAYSIRMEEGQAQAPQMYIIVDCQSEITYLLYPSNKTFIMTSSKFKWFYTEKRADCKSYQKACRFRKS